MASITFLDPSGSNLTTPLLSTVNRKTLNPISNGFPWIYCNYPERIGYNGKDLAIAEKGYYINKQTINGSAQLFFSHWNQTGNTLKYRIRLNNNTSTSTTITCSNIGFSTGWDGTVAVKNFFSSSSSSITVPANGTAWLTPEYSIAGDKNGQPFTGMIRFQSNKSVDITAIAYYNSSKISNATRVYPYSSNTNDEKVYSGLGTGYFLTFSHGTIDTHSMPYRYTTNCNAGNPGLYNANEIIPIKIVGTTKTASFSASELLNNLGNWCVQNRHVLTLRNSSANKVTVYGYIGANKVGNAQVINRGGVVKAAKLSQQTTGKFTWRWCKVELNGYESFTFDFQQVLASFGANATFHEWKVEN